MSNSVTTQNILKIDRKLSYLDLRDSIIKKTFNRKADVDPAVLPTIDKCEI